MRLCEKFIIVRSPRWWWELPCGSECSLVTVKAPRWWWVLPGGSEVSQVVVRALWWQWGLPGGGKGSLVAVSAPWWWWGLLLSFTATVNQKLQCYSACVTFSALMEGNIMVLLLKTHLLYISCYHFPSASVRLISLEYVVFDKQPHPYGYYVSFISPLIW